MRLQTSKKVFLTLLLWALAVPLLGSEAAARKRGISKPRLTRSQRKARRKARVLVKKGVVKLREGDYVAALEFFSNAFRIYPSPKIQFNIGQTYKELGRYLDAIGAYERFLKNVPDSSMALRKLAKDNIRELFRKIAILRLRVSVDGARVSIDGQPRGVSPLKAPLRLMPGSHSMVIKKDGYVTVAVDLRLGPGKQVTRSVTLLKPRPKVVQVVWKTIRKPQKGLPVLWTGIAVTGAAAVVAAITGGLALAEEKRKDDLDLPIAERRAAADRGRRYVSATDGLLLSAGVVAASTLLWYFLYVRPSGGSERVRVGAAPSETSVMPFVAPGGGGVSLRF